jgi:hypothetical protein
VTCVQCFVGKCVALWLAVRRVRTSSLCGESIGARNFYVKNVFSLGEEEKKASSPVDELKDTEEPTR